MVSKALKWCLLFIAALSVLLPAVAYIGVIAALILAIKARKSRELIDVLRRDRPLAAITVAVFASAFFSRAKLLSLGAVALITVNLALFLLIVVDARSTGWERYYRLLNGLSIVVCLYGLYQLFSGSLNIDKSWVDVNTYGYLTRIYSTFSNPNIFAGYLGINLSFAVPRYKNVREDLLLTVNILLSSLCLQFTYSRGGFAGFLVSMLILFLLCRKRKVLIYTAAMTVLFIAVNTAGNVSRADISSVIRDSSSQYRVFIWKSAADMFLKRPILGNGVGTAWYYLSAGSDKLHGYVLHSHNIYLQVAAEMGIIGLLAAIYFILSNLLLSLRMLALCKNGEENRILQGFIACMAGIIVHGLVDAAVFLPRFSIIIMSYYGMYKAALEASGLELYGKSIPKLLGREGSYKYEGYEKENEACEA